MPSPLIIYVRSTTQFVCVCAFHARISDPVIGGTYITVRAASFPSCFPMPNPTSSSTLLQISAALGLDSLFCEVPKKRVTICVEYTDVQTAIDHFSIAACQVGDNGTSLTANGASMEASASMFSTKTAPVQVPSAFQSKGGTSVLPPAGNAP